MKRILALFVMVVFVSVSFINCSEDEVTNPEDNCTHSPIVIIISPSNDFSFMQADTISFTGAGEDYNGIDLPDSMLVWISNRDDTIGTGALFDRDNLSVGTHVITLNGTDGYGNSDTDDIIIHVTSNLITVPATDGYPMGWIGLESDEEPIHTVSLDEFQIGKYEVTYNLWVDVKAWAESNGYEFANVGQRGGCFNPPCGTTDQHPATSVGWRDCIAWCNAYSEKVGLTPAYYKTSAKAEYYRNSWTDGDIGNDCVDWTADGFRLPTEAQWEYAARYIDGINVSSGDRHSGNNLHSYVGNCAWFEDNSGSTTHPAGMLRANSLGANDMSGNVWEWCWDWYGSYPDTSCDNPLGPDSGTRRVI
ncbi:SUMF1/EgtB/PvdO family nonheme iron enzyme, partial [bacterium]|nr:SUMF1/EgtB/PvdO family nonheme iron enzyme [bacterium]